VAEDDARDERLRAGLCAHCRNASTVTSSRSVTFYLCRLSLTDPRYPKYPTLPVRTCDGYTAAEPGERVTL